MIKVLPLEKREDVTFEPRYVLSVSIGYGEHCDDNVSCNEIGIDDEKANGKNLKSYESEYHFITQAKAEEIYKFFDKVLGRNHKYEVQGYVYEGPVDHITLNDGADEYWCKVYCGMSGEEFEWYKNFYEEFEVRLLQPDIEYNWYGILGVNIRYYDEKGYIHRCEIV